MNVTAVLVTRGDVDMEPVLRSLPFESVVVWDNSLRGSDLGVYGRFAALEEVPEGDAVFVQDDDCLLAPESVAALVKAYEPGVLVANMPARFRPHYPDSCLVGFGALFDRDLPAKAFARFGARVEASLFARTCDVVFTTLTPRKLLDLPYENREFASDDNRMWRQGGHVAERSRTLELARQVRDA